VLGFYALMGIHVYAYFTVVLYVLRKRLGTIFGLIWVAIGLSLVYNIAWNHFFATFLKPGSPGDLKVSFFKFAKQVISILNNRERNTRREREGVV
jgi:anionic cell wall polymer biosynthesis LytR-Cps2A-Psr (LCP) family protein